MTTSPPGGGGGVKVEPGIFFEKYAVLTAPPLRVLRVEALVAGSLTEGMAALGTERGSQWRESFTTMYRKPSMAPLHLHHRPEAEVI